MKKYLTLFIFLIILIPSSSSATISFIYGAEEGVAPHGVGTDGKYIFEEYGSEYSTQIGVRPAQDKFCALDSLVRGKECATNDDCAGGVCREDNNNDFELEIDTLANNANVWASIGGTGSIYSIAAAAQTTHFTLDVSEMPPNRQTTLGIENGTNIVAYRQQTSGTLGCFARLVVTGADTYGLYVFYKDTTNECTGGLNDETECTPCPDTTCPGGQTCYNAGPNQGACSLGCVAATAGEQWCIEAPLAAVSGLKKNNRYEFALVQENVASTNTVTCRLYEGGFERGSRTSKQGTCTTTNFACTNNADCVADCTGNDTASGVTAACCDGNNNGTCTCTSSWNNANKVVFGSDVTTNPAAGSDWVVGIDDIVVDSGSTSNTNLVTLRIEDIVPDTKVTEAFANNAGNGCPANTHHQAMDENNTGPGSDSGTTFCTPGSGNGTITEEYGLTTVTDKSSCSTCTNANDSNSATPILGIGARLVVKDNADDGGDDQGCKSCIVHGGNNTCSGNQSDAEDVAQEDNWVPCGPTVLSQTSTIDTFAEIASINAQAQQLELNGDCATSCIIAFSTVTTEVVIQKRAPNKPAVAQDVNGDGFKRFCLTGDSTVNQNGFDSALAGRLEDFDTVMVCTKGGMTLFDIEGEMTNILNGTTGGNMACRYIRGSANPGPCDYIMMVAGINHFIAGPPANTYCSSGATQGDLCVKTRHLLGTDPIATTNSSTTITITDINHGFSTGNTVILSGLSGAVNGIPQSELETSAGRSITVTGTNTYTMTTTTAANATSSGGGSTVRIIKHNCGVGINCDLYPLGYCRGGTNDGLPCVCPRTGTITLFGSSATIYCGNGKSGRWLCNPQNTICSLDYFSCDDCTTNADCDSMIHCSTNADCQGYVCYDAQGICDGGNPCSGGTCRATCTSNTCVNNSSGPFVTPFYENAGSVAPASGSWYLGGCVNRPECPNGLCYANNSIAEAERIFQSIVKKIDSRTAIGNPACTGTPSNCKVDLIVTTQPKPVRGVKDLAGNVAGPIFEAADREVDSYQTLIKQWAENNGRNYIDLNQYFINESEGQNPINSHGDSAHWNTAGLDLVVDATEMCMEDLYGYTDGQCGEDNICDSGNIGHHCVEHDDCAIYYCAIASPPLAWINPTMATFLEFEEATNTCNNNSDCATPTGGDSEICGDNEGICGAGNSCNPSHPNNPSQCRKDAVNSATSGSVCNFTTDGRIHRTTGSRQANQATINSLNDLGNLTNSTAACVDVIGSGSGGNKTWGGWVMATQGGTGTDQVLFSDMVTSGSNLSGFDSWLIGITPSGTAKVEFRCRYGEADASPLSAQAPDDLLLNVWYHLTCTYNDSTKTIKAYIGGVEKASATGSLEMADSGATSVYLGRTAAGTTNEFRGRFDEFFISNHLFTGGEVTRICGCFVRGNTCTCDGDNLANYEVKSSWCTTSEVPATGSGGCGVTNCGNMVACNTEAPAGSP